MEDEYEVSPIVFDSGSQSVKGGFGWSDTPIHVPTVVGKIQEKPQGSGMGYQRTTFVGFDVDDVRDSLVSLHYPIQRGLVKDWDSAQSLWYYMFYNTLRAAPEEHPVFQTEAPHTPMRSREKMTQYHFETYSVPAFYVTQTGPLALYAQGLTSGIVVDCGHEVTHITPVVDGKVLKEAVTYLDYGGKDITNELAKSFGDTSDETILKCEQIKREAAYVSLHCDNEVETAPYSHSLERSFELPDGRVIDLGVERFIATEGLFQPNKVQLDSPGIHLLLNESIQRCEEDIRKDLYNNIILIGGTSLLPGFKERVEKEVRQIAPIASKINVVSPKEGDILAWKAACSMASSLSFMNNWISKEEYDEWGPNIIHRKC